MAKSKPFTLEDLMNKGFVADENGNFAKKELSYGHALDAMAKGMRSLTKMFEIINDNDIKLKKDKRPKATIKIPKNKPEGLQAIERVLKASNVKYELEYRFDEVRQFRFDVAIPDKMLAIEYEGLMSKKSRHTTISGYVCDCRKYNFAQTKGWKILRYTAINYKEFIEDLKHFL